MKLGRHFGAQLNAFIFNCLPAVPETCVSWASRMEVSDTQGIWDFELLMRVKKEKSQKFSPSKPVALN